MGNKKSGRYVNNFALLLNGYLLSMQLGDNNCISINIEHFNFVISNTDSHSVDHEITYFSWFLLLSVTGFTSR